MVRMSPLNTSVVLRCPVGAVRTARERLEQRLSAVALCCSSWCDLSPVAEDAGFKHRALRRLHAVLHGRAIKKKSPGHWDELDLVPQQIRYACEDAWATWIVHLRLLPAFWSQLKYRIAAVLVKAAAAEAAPQASGLQVPSSPPQASLAELAPLVVKHKPLPKPAPRQTWPPVGYKRKAPARPCNSIITDLQDRVVAHKRQSE